MSLGVLAVMVLVSVAVAAFVSWPLLVGKGEPAPGEVDEVESELDHLLVQKEATYTAIKELQFDHAMGNLSQLDYQELSRRYEDRAVALLQTIDEASQEGGRRVAVAASSIDAGIRLGSGRGRELEDDIERQVACLRSGPGGHHKAPADASDEIEREVAALRVGRRRDPSTSRQIDDEIEQQVALLRTGGGQGNRQETAGAALVSSPRPACPSCSATLKSREAAFCSRCGTELRSKCPVCGAPADQSDIFCSECGVSLTRPVYSQMEGTVLGGTNA